jgi:hypothetical protein
MRNICFRFLRFRDAIKSGQLTDPKAVRDTAKQLDQDLETWLETLPPNCKFEIVDTAEQSPESYPGAVQRHVYGDLWAAQAWNNWRGMRIAVNQIILQNHNRSGPEPALDDALLLLHALSTDICVSVASFAESTRTLLSHSPYLF